MAKLRSIILADSEVSLLEAQSFALDTDVLISSMVKIGLIARLRDYFSEPLYLLLLSVFGGWRGGIGINKAVQIAMDCDLIISAGKKNVHFGAWILKSIVLSRNSNSKIKIISISDEKNTRIESDFSLVRQFNFTELKIASKMVYFFGFIVSREVLVSIVSRKAIEISNTPSFLPSPTLALYIENSSGLNVGLFILSCGKLIKSLSNISVIVNVSYDFNKKEFELIKKVFDGQISCYVSHSPPVGKKLSLPRPDYLNLVSAAIMMDCSLISLYAIANFGIPVNIVNVKKTKNSSTLLSNLSELGFGVIDLDNIKIQQKTIRCHTLAEDLSSLVLGELMF